MTTSMERAAGFGVGGGMVGEGGLSEDRAKARDREEKIYVTVRLRPLSSKEVANRETTDWECTNKQTITFKHPLPERSPYPSSYTFDRVFGPDCPTKQVYNDGAKQVALSALTGINSTIFAYGQTSSGKTYTMRGIVESATIDVYSHIQKTGEREFVLKISGLEIYNEVVKDLLNPESGPLRLLDDPDRGTVVERLKEEIVRDYDHLQQIIRSCEAQRQVGETMLNDTSSRSHQIIRLTVESYPRGVLDGSPFKSLIASLNFVDLAGSERASQTLSEGSRLKEGCHINRSLLTLSSVIRKLSGGSKSKSGHIPYRDSKLTRILQHSLGGNARTAIICTMSPAHVHVEQSRNTLFFATRAKEVTNSARVNLVVSDKVLVKQLQKEVARLEAELRVPEASLSSEALLQEKELQIQKMESEMKELALQRDLAQARLDDLLKKMEADGQAKQMDQGYCTTHLPSPGLDVEQDTVLYEDEDVEGSGFAAFARGPQLDRRKRGMGLRHSTSASLMLVQEIRKLEHLQEEVGEDANKALEALQKEVECLRLAQSGMSKDATATIAKLQAEIHELHAQRASVGKKDVPDSVLKSIDTSLMDEISRLHALGENDKSKADAAIATLEEQLESVQMSLDKMVLGSPASKGLTEVPSPTNVRTSSVRKKAPTMGSSSRQRLFAGSSPPSSPKGRTSFGSEQNENTPPRIVDNSSPRVLSKSKRRTPRKAEEAAEGGVCSKESPTVHRRSTSVDIRKVQSMFKTAAEENIRSIRAYVTELKERVAKLQYQKQLLVCQVLELEANGNAGDGAEEVIKEDGTPFVQSPSAWQATYDRQRMQIIELWDICQVSIIHRTQFYLLFRGDPADAIYMEVELRRLTWLKEHMSETDLESPSVCLDENVAFLSASFRNLKRERELLAKRMRTRLTPEERDDLFSKWDIPLDSKQRKLQLAYKLWMDPHDRAHIEASADVVSRVVGVWETENGALKEMFELNFAPPSSQKPWLFGWNPLLNFLNL
ncbi:hypothetical protein O6H91_08G085700 [Diphasiastrum complanatum]|uniref:Uncharacterized protein n=5 Tax=Diphasiastrum complanatum TaxID=34168 RepID=A0ACC2CZI6_DIPCM|nr:hypothetical protein O6H91_08G085700 [Diphasiastrum complanatum]KAJ7547430.1 hypothetical protein O6H91_08G085700 [Diphasiastrum complanatum]KAJ7547431.1 hypothetical protein O6H91_08G085700 [Diphasiastrum complanatum]KAJ7547433.1 hypothetical protein O6H91_08G085700 [Diphasiastrum complanatum]KAJ7547434.1 hypothetical protein O6H91_08G085700 [Diphasiastrum complanatum]